MSGPPLRLVLFGVGGVGCAVARVVNERESARVVVAIDASPRIAGSDVGDVAGLGARLGVPVLPELPANLDADVAIHATSPDIEAIEREIIALAAAGLNVVSVSGAFYLGRRHPQIAKRIDRVARDHGVSIFATGSTPGFFPDVLPAFLGRGFARIDCVRFRRVMDMARWGTGMYPVYGIGRSVESFEAAVNDGSLALFDRLVQSIDYLAYTLGIELDEVGERKLPHTAAETRVGNGISVEPGRVCGFSHVLEGSSDGRTRIEIDYTAIVGLSPSDGLRETTTIEVDGKPSARFEVSGEIISDPKSVYLVTAALALNAAPHVLAAKPGLLLAQDLPFVTPLV